MGRCAVEPKGFEARSVSGRDLRQLESWADVLIFQGLLLSIHPWLRRSEKVLIADIYDPFHLEVLEQEKDKSEAARNHTLTECVNALNVQLRRGDFFLCASPKQRDLWMGQLAGLGRVNPATYDSDETLERLIGVVPFGISDVPPAHHRKVIKGVVKGIGPDDSVILWGGGIYNWFDPLTLIRAIDKLRRRRPDVRLFFLGLKHPNPDVPEMRMSVQARDLSDQLGLTGKHVFFNEGWVSYEDRQNYLLEADIGVSCHLDHVETAYSFRTRILDYLWAGLPIVTTDGDSFGDLVSKEGMGVAVPPEDVEALEAALFRLLDDADFREHCRKKVAEVAPGFTWPNVLKPLLDFCRTPRRAPDLHSDDLLADIAHGSAFVERYRPSMAQNLELARTYLREGGPREVAVRAWGRVKRQLRERLGGGRR
jgi:glycosyltransferase involved in cell wall biosynthesis